MDHILIQGFFFQHQAFFQIVQRAESEGGAGVIIQPGLMRCIFSGVISQDPRNALGGLLGEMTDYFGESILSDIRLTENCFTFQKKYNDRPDSIQYIFRKEKSFWTGEWQGLAVGKGKAVCITTKVPESFFTTS